MTVSHHLKTLQSLLTHYAKTGEQRRVVTKIPKSELLKLTGARSVEKVVMYPHMWLNGENWQTTTFELIPGKGK